MNPGITNILYALGVLGVLGALFGLLLGIASRIFHVDVDERIEKITEALPGANCGGCGYAGCSGYAEAIVKDGAATNLCTSGGQKAAKAIAGIMGVEAAEVVPMIAFVHCSGGNNADKKYQYTGLTDCFSVSNSTGGGPLTCKYGCLGYGSCVAACKFDAIHIVNGVGKVDRNKCTGCSMCARTCPKHIIEMVPVTQHILVPCLNQDKGGVIRKFCMSGCIGCRACERNCPNGAITVVNNVAHVDTTKCKHCMTCVLNCPRKLVKDL